jgi:protein-S-isoprenylcysteine O-methyltransferase Ste14
VDARAELMAKTSDPTPSVSEVKVLDATSVVRGGAVAHHAIGQLTEEYPMPRQVDVEALLVALAASGAVATSVPPIASPLVDSSDDGRSWTANWLGVLVMALGLVLVLTGSRKASLRPESVPAAIGTSETRCAVPN